MMSDANDTDRALILAWFADFQEHDGDEELTRYVVHCGIDIDAAAELDDAIAAHYRLPSGIYDIERAANDLATYPPIAARIEELRAEKAETDR
jgi:DNA/RNA-binding domain of Phe-tRNA-synthetase-like protein